jgi:hypothetical protein
MNKLIIDYETYWGAGFTLRSTPIQEYVTDERFEVLSVSYQICSPQGELLKRVDLGGSHVEEHMELFRGDTQYDLVAANTKFELTILKQHFNVDTERHFRYRYDIQNMTRWGIGFQVPQSLKFLSSLLLSNKEKRQGTLSFKDKYIEDLSYYEILKMMSYCRLDVEYTKQIFFLLLPLMNETSTLVADQLNRWGTEPHCVLDREMLSEALKEEQEVKDKEIAIVEDLGFKREQLTSNPKFAEVLSLMGVEPPRKISERTNKETWAFAKDDLEFKDLLVHEDPNIRKIVRARMTLKSTLMETRIKRFITLHDRYQGEMIFPMRFMSANTGRTGGEFKLNTGNLKRGSVLRRAIRAKKGWKLGFADYSAQEVRAISDLAEHKINIKAFADQDAGGADFYKAKAAINLGLDVEDITKDQRFLSKVQQLALQYRQRGKGYQGLLALGPFGNDPIYLTERQAWQQVNEFERNNIPIVKLWNKMDDIIAHLVAGTKYDYKYLHIEGQNVTFPNGHTLNFQGLKHYDDSGYSLFYPRSINNPHGELRKLYAGLMTNNTIQGLAASLTNDAIARIAKSFIGRPMYMLASVYDEILFTAPDAYIEEACQIVEHGMGQTPEWMESGVEFGVDAEYNDFYGK